MTGQEKEVKKIKNKIPRWFKNQSQINSSILINYLLLSNKDSKIVDVDTLEKKCLRVEDFQGNYDQMKNFGAKNHGKVFTEEDKKIKLWKPVKEYILEEWSKYDKEESIPLDIKIDSTKDVSDNNTINTKNIILYGAPGVGKTHNYKKLISMIDNAKNGEDEKTIFKTIIENKSTNEDISDIDKEKIEFVCFHQSYSYEDFIEGLRPNEDGKIKPQDGTFKSFCKKAEEENDENFYMVIDEINRGNISKIFGELITLIEESKRNNYEVTLPYSKEKFSVPSNLYIIATMNSTDKSIATVDIALRRRFTFLKMKPNVDLVSDEGAKEFMIKCNEYIKDKLGEDYMLGHSYFMEENIDLEFIKEYKIKPLLEEYFYAEEKSVDDILEEIDKK